MIKGEKASLRSGHLSREGASHGGLQRESTPGGANTKTPGRKEFDAFEDEGDENENGRSHRGQVNVDLGDLAKSLNSLPRGMGSHWKILSREAIRLIYSFPLVETEL